MNNKIIFTSFILLLILTSACVNTNVTPSTQKDTPIQTFPPETTPAPAPVPTEKLINLNAQQIILNDTEIKDVLGNGFTKKFQDLTPQINDTTSAIVWYGGTDYPKHLASINVIVYNDLNTAITDDQISVVSYVGIKNQIKIGNTTGELYSYVGKNESNPIGSSKITFRRNNIIVSIDSSSDIEIQKSIELAKKQDEKISGILEIIQ